MKSKLTDVCLWLNEKLADIYLITETWLDEEILSSEFLPQGFSCLRRDRNRNGGGILMVFRQELQVLKAEIATDCEAIFCCFTYHHVRGLLGLCYLPPPVSSEDIDILEDFITTAVSKHPIGAPLIMAGDFNIPEMTGHDFIQPSARARNLDLLVNALGLFNPQPLATRMGAPLDLMLANIPITLTTIEPTVNSDHLELTGQIEWRARRSRPKWKPNFKTSNWEAINEFLHLHPPNSSDLNEHERWIRELDHILLRFTQRTHVEKRRPKWFDSDVKEARKAVLQAHHDQQTYPSHTNKEKLKDLRRQLRSLTRQKFNDFICDIERNARLGNMSPFWNYVRERRTSNQCNGNSSGTSYPDKVQTANNLSLFFEQKLKAKPLNHLLEASTLAFPLISNIQFTNDEVKKVLRAWRTQPVWARGRVGKGFFGILEPTLSPTLVRMFSDWLKQAGIPPSLKIIDVTPIPKVANSQQAQDFRPISQGHPLTTAIESLIFHHLSEALHNRLSVLQHGFFKGRSTITNLISFWEEVIDNAENGQPTATIFFDVSQAFDSVPHHVLIERLGDYGVPDSISQWLEGFLANREFAVSFQGVRSKNRKIGRGVPQGSPLGPLLFNIFVDPIIRSFENRSPSLLAFADDWKLFSPCSIGVEARRLQDAINDIVAWCSANGLSINSGKTVLMIFKPSGMKDPDFYPVIDGIPIRRVSVHKDLGILLSEDLSFVLQTQRVLVKANRTIGLIKRISCETRDGTLPLSLFNALVHPSLDYGAPLWWPNNAYWSTQLERLATKFLRWHYRKFMDSSITRIFPTDTLRGFYRWETLSSRRNKLNCILLHRIFSSQIDAPHLLAKICFHVPQRRTRSASQFATLHKKTERAKQAFIYKTCRMVDENLIDMSLCPRDLRKTLFNATL